MSLYIKQQEAVNANDMTALEKMYKTGIRFNTDLIMYVVKKDNLDIFKFLLNCETPINKQVGFCAITFDSINCVKYLASIKFPFEKNSCNLAAISGSLNCLLFFVNKNFTVDESSAITAIKNDNVECFKILQTTNNFSKKCIETAIKYNSKKCLMHIITALSLFDKKTNYDDLNRANNRIR